MLADGKPQDYTCPMFYLLTVQLHKPALSFLSLSLYMDIGYDDPVNQWTN